MSYKVTSKKGSRVIDSAGILSRTPLLKVSDLLTPVEQGAFTVGKTRIMDVFGRTLGVADEVTDGTEIVLVDVS